MKKKIWAFLPAVFLLLSLCACGIGKAGGNPPIGSGVEEPSTQAIVKEPETKAPEPVSLMDILDSDTRTFFEYCANTSVEAMVIRESEYNPIAVIIDKDDIWDVMEAAMELRVQEDANAGMRDERNGVYFVVNDDEVYFVGCEGNTICVDGKYYTAVGEADFCEEIVDQAEDAWEDASANLYRRENTLVSYDQNVYIHGQILNFYTEPEVGPWVGAYTMLYFTNTNTVDYTAVEYTIEYINGDGMVLGKVREVLDYTNYPMWAYEERDYLRYDKIVNINDNDILPGLGSTDISAIITIHGQW